MRTLVPRLSFAGRKVALNEDEEGGAEAAERRVRDPDWERVDDVVCVEWLRLGPRCRKNPAADHARIDESEGKTFVSRRQRKVRSAIDWKSAGCLLLTGKLFHWQLEVLRLFLQDLVEPCERRGSPAMNKMHEKQTACAPAALLHNTSLTVISS